MGDLSREAATIVKLASPVELRAVPGRYENDSHQVRTDRINFVRDRLIERGVPGHLLTAIPTKQAPEDLNYGEVRLRFIDRGLATIRYYCYPAPP